MYQLVSRCLLSFSIFVLIATSPADKGEYRSELSGSSCTSAPLSLTLGPDNMSEELQLELANYSDLDMSYFLEFTILGSYSGEENALLTLSALDENGQIIEDHVISTELEPTESGDTEEITLLGSLTSQDLNEGQIGLYGFLIELDSSYEYSFDLAVFVLPHSEEAFVQECYLGVN